MAPAQGDFDWSEHAVSLTGLLSGVVVVLGGVVVKLLRAGMKQREEELTHSISALHAEVRELRSEIAEERQEIFLRLRAAEQRLGEQMVKCDIYHNQGRPHSEV